MYLRDLQKGTYVYFLDWTFFPILAQYVLHTFVNSMDCQTNTDHDWNYNEWSKQSIWTEYKAHSYLTYILFGVRQNANLFEVFSVLMNILLSSEYDLWNKINSSKGLNPVQIEILFKIWSWEIHFKLKFCWVMILKWTKFRQSVT